MSISKDIAFDHSIDTEGRINVRTVTRIMENGKELSRSYHRKVVDPVKDDMSGMDQRTRLLSRTLRNDLKDIHEGLEDAEVVSEGETIGGEAIKKATWMERLKEFWENAG